MTIRELMIGKKVREPLSGLVFQIAAQEHPGYPGTVLVLDTVLKQKSLDAKEPMGTDDQKKYGNNYFPVSNLCRWLNSDEMADWYRPAHERDAAPDLANCYDGRHAYHKDRGFLATLSIPFKEAMVVCDVPCLKAQAGGPSVLTTAPLKVWLPSLYEIGYATGKETPEGSLMPLFRDIRNRLAAPDAYAFGLEDRLYFHRGANYWYWLRTPVDGTDCLSWHTQHGLGYGMNVGEYPCYGHTGVRPMVALRYDTVVSQEPDEYGVYELFEQDRLPYKFDWCGGKYGI